MKNVQAKAKERKTNNSNINRLCNINLYEPDYNLILKFFWHQKSTHLAEETKKSWREHLGC